MRGYAGLWVGKHSIDSNVRGESPLKSLVRKSTKQFQTILAHKVVINSCDSKYFATIFISNNLIIPHKVVIH